MAGYTGFCRTLAVAVVLLAGCATGQPVASPSPDLSSSSASPKPSRPPLPSSDPSVLPPNRSDCVASTELATVRPNEQAGPVCLLVGAKLQVSSAPSPSQPWQLLASSDPDVLKCTSTAGSNGTVIGNCMALDRGSAVVTTRTKSPANGASDYWRLVVFVQ